MTNGMISSSHVTFYWYIIGWNDEVLFDTNWIWKIFYFEARRLSISITLKDRISLNSSVNMVLLMVTNQYCWWAIHCGWPWFGGGGGGYFSWKTNKFMIFFSPPTQIITGQPVNRVCSNIKHHCYSESMLAYHVAAGQTFYVLMIPFCKGLKSHTLGEIQ